MPFEDISIKMEIFCEKSQDPLEYLQRINGPPIGNLRRICDTLEILCTPFEICKESATHPIAPQKCLICPQMLFKLNWVPIENIFYQILEIFL